MDFTAALPTFVVTLREGFEATLVVGIVCACLKKAEQTQLYRWVYLGVSGGIVASISIGFLLAGAIGGLETAGGIYAPVVKQLLAGIFGLVAIAMLSWMLLWMTQQARSIKSEVEGTISQALTTDVGAGKAIFLLIFIAVLREGFETVLFILAKFQQAWTLPAIGAVAGLIMAVVLGILLFAMGVRINIRLFFQVMGIFLLLIVGGLVLGALYHFDAALALISQLSPQYAGWCISDSTSCLLGSQVWDGSAFLPDKQFPGILLKSLFGYRQTLYLGQVVAYILFLATMGTAYFQSLTGTNTLQKAPE
ncbi:MAG: FTR1 family protein [Xenococcaceae cyanobacterium MO_188.B32]|nr:FTR1 family protein [Xenococcaceae cyanobacterium MO_188.B32]